MSANNELAILGGPKALTQKTPHFVWPVIDKKIERAVVSQLYENISIYDRSGIFEKFETEYAGYHNVKYALLCSSGTLAIHTMYVAAGLEPGDEVICPAYTFFATVTPLLFTGAVPILCDADVNGNIDPKKIEKLITNRTKAVVVTHMWGVPCQMMEIVKICRKHKLLLLEDCSHAHGARINNKVVGSFGDMAAWSLQGAKVVTGGEGGIMVTNNKEFYIKGLLLGHYNKRCKQEIPADHPYRQYAVTGMGLKYRAHPLAIRIAYEIFKNLDEILRMKNKYAAQFISAFNSLPGIKPPKLASGVQPSWYALTCQYHASELKNVSLERFLEAAQAEGLSEYDNPGSTQPLNLLALFQKPEQLFPNYKKYKFSYRPDQFPEALKFYKNAIKLPVWSAAKDQVMVNAYIKGTKKVINNIDKLL